MFPQEAIWIQAILSGVPAESLGPVLDIGSSDHEYRKVKKPWIQIHVFAPLDRRGVEVAYCDVKNKPGVDLVVDLMDDDDLVRLRGMGWRTVLCCNVLEHVPDARAFAARLETLVESGGRLILTVPNRYPRHNDPIDTMFRPSVEELAALFPVSSVERSVILETGSYREEFARRPLTLFLRHLLRLPAPFLGLDQWKRSVTKLQFLFRPYRVTCVCLVKQ